VASNGTRQVTLKTRIPSYVYITPASVKDVNEMDQIPYEQSSYYFIIYEILQIPGISLLYKTPVKELLTNNNYKNVKNCYSVSFNETVGCEWVESLEYLDSKK
jgi:hypothetical protein